MPKKQILNENEASELIRQLVTIASNQLGAVKNWSQIAESIASGANIKFLDTIASATEELKRVAIELDEAAKSTNRAVTIFIEQASELAEDTSGLKEV